MGHIVGVAVDLLVHNGVGHFAVAVGGNQIQGVTVDGVVDSLTDQGVVEGLDLLVHGDVLDLGAHGGDQLHAVGALHTVGIAGRHGEVQIDLTGL